MQWKVQQTIVAASDLWVYQGLTTYAVAETFAIYVQLLWR